MFKPKKIIQEAANRVLAVLRAYKRGDTVTWEAIEEASGFAKYSTHWPALIQRVRKTFLKIDRVSLWAVRDVGFKLHTVEEQLYARSVLRQRKALKQTTLERKELAALPDNLLTQRQRLDKYRKLQQATDSRKAVLRSLRLAHVLAQPSNSGIPRVRPPK